MRQLVKIIIICDKNNDFKKGNYNIKMNNIQLFISGDINPYKILKIINNSSINDIKQSYKKLALSNHPDRGGNSTKFKLIQDAYLFVMYEAENKSVVNKKISNTSVTSNGKHTNVNNDKVNNDKIKKITKEQFNELFEKYNTTQHHIQKGYSNEEILNTQTQLNKNNTVTKANFDNQFSEHKKHNTTTQIIPYHDMANNAKTTLNYTIIGQDNIDDYTVSSESNKLDGYDIKKAHELFIDPQSVKITNTDQINFQKYVQDRKNISIAPTQDILDEDYAAKAHERMFEMRRLDNLKRLDAEYALKHQQFMQEIR